MDPETKVGGLVTRLKNFLAQPFTDQMDLGNWFLFTILIVTIVVMWTRVLAHVEPLEV